MNDLHKGWIARAVLPTVILLAALLYAPLVATLLDSVSDSATGRLTLAHYLALLDDQQVRRGILWTLGYSFASTCFSLVWGGALAAAVLLEFTGKRWFIALSRIPLVVPGVVVAFMTLAIFEQGGVLARLLAVFGIAMPPMVRDPRGIGVVIAMAWKEAPLMGFIIGSSLAVVPDSAIQAARSLGASAFQAFLLIRLPLALPGIVAAALLGFIRAIGAFAIPSLLGAAYPKPISVLMFEAFENGNWPRVCSLAILLSGVSLAAAFLYYQLLGRVSNRNTGRPTRPRPGK